MTLPASAGAQGGLDPTFGDDGLFELAESAFSFSSAPDVYEDGPNEGKIVLAGSTSDSPYRGFVARLNTDGTRDASFGENGLAFLPPGSFASDVALYSDGSIAYANDADATVGRVLPDGSPDAEFGEVDLYDPDQENRTSSIPDLEVDGRDDDLIVPLAVTRYAGLGYGAGVIAEVYRFNKDGSRDQGWASGGSAPVDYDEAGFNVPFLSEIEVGNDGSVWASGSAYSSPGTYGVQRFTDAGVPDPELTPETDAGALFAQGRALALEPGTSDMPVVLVNGFIRRVANDGTLVPGSSADPLPAELGDFRDLEVDGGGRVFAMFANSTPYTTTFSVARFGADGALDLNFGRDGSTSIRWPEAVYSGPTRLAVTDSTQLVGADVTKLPYTAESAPIAALARLSDANDVDPSVPETTISSGPAEGSTILDPRPAFGFSTDLPRASLECAVENTWRAGRYEPCLSPFSLYEQPNGKVTFRVRAVSVYAVADEPPASRTFTIDAESLQTHIVSGPAEGSTIRQDTATFGLSSSPGDAYYYLCSLDGSEPDNCGDPYEAQGLDEGRHTVRFQAVDGGGRVDPTPAVRHFKVNLPPPVGPTCDFPELRTPPTLRAAAKKDITASVLCPENATAEVKLRVTKEAAEAFGLNSRTIGSGRGNLVAAERGEIEANLGLKATKTLSRFRGSTVYFKATVVPTGDNGGDGPPVSRYGQFTVGR
ncbi:MAG: large repetitive protein [Solirubrobacterales bacterium]|jgi:uncharacterized delta-60 repeat protein|nr:large repetitive protein [Solirubrobacterales bacterium]